jgi:hypothetical protein
MSDATAWRTGFTRTLQLMMFHRVGMHSFLPQLGPVGHGRPFGPNRLVVQFDRPEPYPPFGSGRSLSPLPGVRRVLFAVFGPRNGLRLDVHSEELVEGRQQLFGAQPTLLDVNDGPRLVIEDGHR